MDSATRNRTMMEHQQREAVVQEALSWLGTPHHHQARIKGAGVDCGQLLLQVYHQAGMIPEVEAGNYPHDWHMHRGEERYLGFVERFAHQIDTEPLPGDVVLFRYGRCISHGGIVYQWPTIIHAYIKRGVILDDALRNQELRSRLAGVWSLWGKA